MEAIARTYRGRPLHAIVHCCGTVRKQRFNFQAQGVVAKRVAIFSLRYATIVKPHLQLGTPCPTIRKHPICRHGVNHRTECVNMAGRPVARDPLRRDISSQNSQDASQPDYQTQAMKAALRKQQQQVWPLARWTQSQSHITNTLTVRDAQADTSGGDRCTSSSHTLEHCSEG
jgi:hypothetical protein